MGVVVLSVCYSLLDLPTSVIPFGTTECGSLADSVDLNLSCARKRDM